MQTFLTKTSSPPTIIVSLSGGVDSMVIAKILVLLRDSPNTPPLRILAVHIDYANRPESSLESSYISAWCDRHYIEFHLNTITSITRGITSRDEYEKISRDIRYDMYKQVIASCPQNALIPVYFGHHLGDVQVRGAQARNALFVPNAELQGLELLARTGALDARSEPVASSASLVRTVCVR